MLPVEGSRGGDMRESYFPRQSQESDRPQTPSQPNAANRSDTRKDPCGFLPRPLRETALPGRCSQVRELDPALEFPNEERPLDSCPQGALKGASSQALLRRAVVAR